MTQILSYNVYRTENITVSGKLYTIRFTSTPDGQENNKDTHYLLSESSSCLDYRNTDVFTGRKSSFKPLSGARLLK